uniref:Methyltransf_11 domain-containing protein n=1 Tax=Syphacia muris TaxID=451379 RepID=A0A0N5AUJ7_9BILA
VDSKIWCSYAVTCASSAELDSETFKEIRRILKDGGVFTIVDIDGTGSVYLDKKANAENSTLMYLFSVFSCLPCSSNASDAFCLGNRCGRKRSVEILNMSGFNNVKVVDLPVPNQVITLLETQAKFFLENHRIMFKKQADFKYVLMGPESI